MCPDWISCTCATVTFISWSLLYNRHRDIFNKTWSKHWDRHKKLNNINMFYFVPLIYKGWNIYKFVFNKCISKWNNAIIDTVNAIDQTLELSTSLSLLIDYDQVVSIWHDIGHPSLYTKGDEFTLSMVPITIYRR